MEERGTQKDGARLLIVLGVVFYSPTILLYWNAEA